MANPVSYFEIPVTDMERATAFYTRVFGFSFERDVVDGYEMAFFPQSDGPGVSGALVKGDIYVPGKQGSVVYFAADNIVYTLERVRAAGSIVLYDIKDVGEFGLVAEFEDCEGNRIALHKTKKQ